MVATTMPNDRNDIPDGERLTIADETTLDVPDLPGEWRWTTANHYRWNHKVNVFFGVDQHAPGGWLGEIDNFSKDDTELWALHVRPVEADGTDTGTPRAETETITEFQTLAAAIEAVPGHIQTNYDYE